MRNMQLLMNENKRLNYLRIKLNTFLQKTKNFDIFLQIIIIL